MFVLVKTLNASQSKFSEVILDSKKSYKILTFIPILNVH